MKPENKGVTVEDTGIQFALPETQFSKSVT